MVFSLCHSSQAAEEGASSASPRGGVGQGGGHSWSVAGGRKGTGCMNAWLLLKVVSRFIRSPFAGGCSVLIWALSSRAYEEAWTICCSTGSFPWEDKGILQWFFPKLSWKYVSARRLKFSSRRRWQCLCAPLDPFAVGVAALGTLSVDLAKDCVFFGYSWGFPSGEEESS